MSMDDKKRLRLMTHTALIRTLAERVVAGDDPTTLCERIKSELGLIEEAYRADQQPISLVTAGEA